MAAIGPFVAVFPAEVSTVRVLKGRPIGYRLGAIARPPLPLPMITTAWTIVQRSAPVRAEVQNDGAAGSPARQ